MVRQAHHPELSRRAISNLQAPMIQTSSDLLQGVLFCLNSGRMKLIGDDRIGLNHGNLRF